jgi:riboflavin kinase / FMN adenylyltransferase
VRLSRFDADLARPSVVAFGVFDGLHRGHQGLIADVVRLARENDAVASIVTFDPHPALVLSPATAPLLLSTLDQRLEGFELLGVEQVGILGFDERSAAEGASSFVRRVLVDRLGVCDLVVGDDVHFGRDREGDIALLESEGRRHDFRVHPSPTYGGDRRYSSSAVRSRLAEGDLAGANHVLGRPFVLRGTVVAGDRRGRELGFPTANLSVGPRQQLPHVGIYAGAVRLGGGAWSGAAISVGTRPQFYDQGKVLVEVHLIDFAGDLYGAVLDVAFLSHLRAERAFDTLDSLVAQMRRDVDESREIFGTFTPSASVLLG